MRSTRSIPRTTLALVVGCVGVLTLAACGGSSDGGSATPTSAASSLPGGGASTGRPQGPGAGRAPGVSGTIAAIDGTTLQVQSTSEQTAVDYTPKTRITAQVKTASSTLAVGDCVTVRTASEGTTPSTSPTAANGGAPATTTGPIAASTVTIISTDGCRVVTAGDGGGFPGGGFPGGGPPPSGPPSGLPSDAPSGLPSDAPSGRPTGGFPGGGRLGGFGAMGEVTSLAPGAFTLSSTLPRFAEGSASASPTASPTATPVQVTYANDTTFLTTASAKASSIKVGSCVRATGKTDDTGKLTATSLVLSQPVDGSCNTGVRGG